MFELAVILLRFLQFAGVTALLGASLFFLYALPPTGVAAAHNIAWPRMLLLWGAAMLAISSAASVVTQTIVLAGSYQEGLTAEAIAFVTLETDIGHSAVVRIVAGAAAVVALFAYRAGRPWWLTAAAGIVACMSVPWMGHGAATEGPWWLAHVLSDIIHTAAASIWVGALLSFALLLTACRPRPIESERALETALAGFSGIGSVLVAVLLATGLANAWFIVGGIVHLQDLWETAYGRVLSAKVGVFGLMLCLAAMNRFCFTPRLSQVLDRLEPPAAALTSLRGSVTIETTLAFGALALVAWLGTLAPPLTR